MAHRLAELAEIVDARIVGDPDTAIEDVCTLEQGRPGCIAFLANSRYRRHLAGTKASAVLVREQDADEAGNTALLIVEDPYLAYARIAALLHPEPEVPAGIHPTAVVAEDARIAPDAWIGPHVVIESGAGIGGRCRIDAGTYVGRDARIGEETRLCPNVTVMHGVTIGRRCIVHSGAVIGSDGFGLARDGERWVKVPQLGSVRIGDDVEIGANTTIDRGAIEDTVIEDGVKLDNQIQVAHNVRIGENTAIAGCAGISGSADIGRNCMLGGGVGVVGHLSIADGCVVTGMSMVTHDLREPGVYSSGLPAIPNEKWNRIAARLRHLDDLARRLQRLERKLQDED
ncbi:MAG TPA: UDP-3-O-(3-hydroxymyristoyl)glucosamine N-acyltransferase [Thiotrichales bacterium]|nr:UDP-3-O-(3-hydroxymyristoyl)glucosamine N-acyltransferase [Thiotrichales bacterium]